LTAHLLILLRKLCKKKRQLKESLREKIASELLDGNKTAANKWRNEEANRLMIFGDNVPPILMRQFYARLSKGNQTSV